MDLLPFDEYVRTLNRKRMSAGVLFHDGAGRVLLIEPSYKDHWDIPGGAVEAGETPWGTAVREVREELGIDWELGRLLVIDYMPADGRMPEGLAFIFDGGLVSSTDVESFVLTDPEILSTSLYTIDHARSIVKASLAARLEQALAAVRSETFALCDSARWVGS